MKKLILLSILLIVGCDKNSTEGSNSTESSVHPLVGVWEFVQAVYTFTALECSSEELNEDYTETAQEFQSTMVFNVDGLYVYSGGYVLDTNAELGGEFSGTGIWTTTNNNKLVITYTDEDYTDTETWDYSITGTTLTLSMSEVNEIDCRTALAVFTFTKQ